MSELTNTVNQVLLLKVIVSVLSLLLIILAARVLYLLSWINFLKEAMSFHLDTYKKSNNPLQILVTQSKLIQIFQIYKKIIGINLIDLYLDEETYSSCIHKRLRKKFLPLYEKYQSYKDFLSQNMGTIEVDRYFT